MKIAILLTAHKNQRQTQRLINHLSKDFDVYIHIDKRSDMEIQKSDRVFVYKKYKAYWGSFNQIMSILFLLEKAYEKRYDRYILISGQDLPLVSNCGLAKFFDKNKNEYIDIYKADKSDTSNPHKAYARMVPYYTDVKHREAAGWESKKSRFSSFMDKMTIKILEAFGKRAWDYEFHSGANWFNLTGKCVGKIFEYLKRDRKYIKRFRWTRSGDEIFFQTIIAQLNGIRVVSQSLRYVDFNSGPEYPRTLRSEDYEKIIKSGKLFARKFDETVDGDIIERIYSKAGAA